MPSLAFVCRDVIAARLGAGLTPFYVGSMEAYRVIEQFLQALRFPQTMFRKPYHACHQGRMRPAVAPRQLRVKAYQCAREQLCA
jgi:hypothetical protein